MPKAGEVSRIAPLQYEAIFRVDDIENPQSSQHSKKAQ